MTSCAMFILIMTLLSLHTRTQAASSSIYDKCEYYFSYLNATTGTFSSPGYPAQYPSLLDCTYIFDAAPNGGVFIIFDHFELERKREGEDVCRYDYIDVFTVDKRGVKHRLDKFCGLKLPQEITSPQSKLEIQFVTDHWQNLASGFHGRYRFLGNDHQPFDHTPEPCGDKRITGVSGFISSPSYPDTYPPLVNCSWIINVPKGKRILLRIDALDFDLSRNCKGAELLLYNGYVSPSTIATKSWCGQMSDYDTKDLQYVTNTNRTVVRFTSGPRNDNRNKGFKLMWMALSIIEKNETCHGFQCKGTKRCHQARMCQESNKYCIPHSLVCNGVRNCGPLDDSDEIKCPRDILIVAACIGVPSLGFLLIIIIVAYCYKSKHVQKSTSQDQPLTHSQSQGNASHDSFTSNHHQMILHTSFVDGMGATPTNVAANHEDPDDIDLQTTRGLFNEGPSNSLRTHKKRPSYHMMQQNYEDGNLIVAQI